MKQKISLCLFSLLLIATSSMFAMESLSLQKDSGLIQLVKVPANQELILPETGKIKDGFVCLDTSKDEPILYTSFKELMATRAKYSLPFILALVSCKVPSQVSTQPSSTIRHAFYEATGLNKALFGDISYNEQTDKHSYYKNRLNLPPNKFQDPFTKLYITGIRYYALEPQNQEGQYICDDLDLFIESPVKSFLNKLFFLYTNINMELAALERDGGHSKKDLYAYLNNLGALYANQGNYKKAEKYYLRATQQTDYPYITAMALNNLGTLYYNQKDYKKAEKYWQQATQQTDDLVVRATVLDNLGLLYYQQKAYKNAETYWQQAAQQTDDLKIKARALYDLGVLYDQYGYKNDAEQYYLKATQQTDDLHFRAMALNNLGTLYANQRDYRNAETYLQQIAGQTDDLKMQAQGLFNLGFLYYNQHDYKKAEQYYLKATRQTDNLKIKAKALYNLGALYDDLGDYENAETYLQQAAQQIDDLKMKAMAKEALAQLANSTNESHSSQVKKIK